MSDEHHSGLLYGLEQRIPPLPAFFSALQHVLAALVGIITPPLIIGATLPGLATGCRISSVCRCWPRASALSAVQSGMGHRRRDDLHAGHQFCLPRRDGGRRDVGKSQGGGPQDMMAMLFGVNFVAALVPVIVSRFIEPLKKIFTPHHYRQRDCADRHQPDQGQRHQLVRWGKGRGFRQHEQHRAQGGHPRGYRPAELRQKPLAAALLGGGGHCRGLHRSGAERSVPSSQPGRHSVSPADAVSVRLSV